MSSKRILFADNDAEFLESRARLLQPMYEVFLADSPESAERILRETWIHLAILDIRLSDDDDSRDESGLSLARRPAYRNVPKMILTNFHNREQTVAALRSGGDGPPTYDFIWKNQGSELMVAAVERVFAEHVHINWNLSIAWEAGNSFYHLVSLIEPGLDNQQMLEWSSELEDVFRKLFYEYTRITISSILSHVSETVFLKVFAHNASSTLHDFVVACGKKEQIAQDTEGYKRVATPKIGINGTVKTNTVETLHYGATAYKLGEANIEEIVTFREFYKTQSPEVVQSTLTSLFEHSLPSWHKQNRTLTKPSVIPSLYRNWLDLERTTLPLSEIDRRIESICNNTLALGLEALDYTPDTITLKRPDHADLVLPNPAFALFDDLNIGSTSMLSALTHGWLTIDTLLTNNQAQPCLVDFSHTGVGLLAQDFVLLEATIKLELLPVTNLHDRLVFEQQLLERQNLRAHLPSDSFSPDLHRAFSAIAVIRSFAATQADVSWEVYQAGLLFYAIKHIISLDPTKAFTTRRGLIPYSHAVLLAGLLYAGLAQTTPGRSSIPEQGRTGFWIDEANMQIWIEGRQIGVTPQEYKILAYLYQHAGTLCSRQDILHNALAENGEALLEESRLNSAMSRLRRKIESASVQQKYLNTVRGYGFKLDV